MNIMNHYKHYKRAKIKNYFIAYNCILKQGKNGWGSVELKISGHPDMRKIREYILSKNDTFESIIIVSITETRPSKGVE